MRIVIVLLILFNSLILSQRYSVGFMHSRFIEGKNYNSALAYSLEGDYGVLNNYIKMGVNVSIVDARISKSFIKNSTTIDPFELSFKVGIHIKYSPFENESNLSSFKPYISIELGDYISGHIVTYLNMPSGCEDLYRFNLPNSIYTNIGLGTDIYFDENYSINIGGKYQIFNPTINYEKPNCVDDNVTSYSKYTETVNLSMLMWSIGLRVNF